MTGHELIAELQRHPEWLHMQVVLLAPDSDNNEDGVLLAVDYDRFGEHEPDVLVLSALKCDAPVPAAPSSTSFTQPDRRRPAAFRGW